MDTWAGEGGRLQFASDQSLVVYFDQQNKKAAPPKRIPDVVPDVAGTGGTGERSFARPLQSEITRQANENVRKLLRLLELEPVAGVRNLHPAYCSLLIKFDALRMGHDELEAVLRRYLQRLVGGNLPEPRQREIPVCYGGEVGAGLGEEGGVLRGK